ncbi:MAG: cyclopropane-fatty-acyl-phospholipid synthase [Cellvibrionales bacterium]|nr:cyclopropane-fatty-acyl-phospholipid synthase [Cellvibrionales bacterium]
MATVAPSYHHLTNRLSASRFDEIAYQKVIAHFSTIRYGCLIMVCEGRTEVLGQKAAETDLVVTLTVNNKAMFRHILFGGMIAAAEMYMVGAWDVSDLQVLVRLMCRNIDVLNAMDQKRHPISKLFAKLLHVMTQNTLKGGAKNISAHYDLSNDFFETFLDSSKMYSSAVFQSPNDSLEQAAQYKLDLICQKLQLTPTDHLIEIGTGWGGMAIHAAKHYGCQVTTTTISEEQYRYATQKVNALGLSDNITVLKKDYRELSGQFDKLVSIEMIEAVGYRFYDNYFEKCSSLLKDDGLALIQAITISDQRYDDAKKEIDFIQRYIFPGGCLPSISVISNALAKYTDMQLIDLHDISSAYAKTLAEWRVRFYQNKSSIFALGFDEIFYRMWEYYLCYCEGGFREHVIQTSQLLMRKPQAYQATSLIKR